MRRLLLLLIMITFLSTPVHALGIRDQGQIFDTGGQLDLETDEWSQSITTGIAGQLTEIIIQFHYGVPPQPPALKFSIFDGGNPISGSALFSEQLFITSVDLHDENLFTWDISSAGLFFNVGDVFCFVLQADGVGYNIAGNDPPGYVGGELFKNGMPSSELSDIAFITYVEPMCLEEPCAIEDGYNGAWGARDGLKIGQSFRVPQASRLISATMRLSANSVDASGIFDINVYEFSEITAETGAKLASISVDMDSLPIGLQNVPPIDFYFPGSDVTLNPEKLYLLTVEPRFGLFGWIHSQSAVNIYSCGHFYYNESQGWQSVEGQNENEMEFCINVQIEMVEIDDIIEFFYKGYETGTIEGSGRKSWLANVKLWIFGQMLESAKWCLEKDKTKSACKLLKRIERRCDSERKPKDFIKGEAVQELADMIMDLMEDLGCE